MMNIFPILIVISILTVYPDRTIRDNKQLKTAIISTLPAKKQVSIVQQKANFITAYNLTMKFEGGYVNDPNDNGGETYKGITRKYNSKWAGWAIINTYKRRKNFPAILSSVQELELMVQELYKKDYWDKIHGDEILNQEIANQLFDSCINMGTSQGIKMLQNSIGVSMTGKMDNVTLKSLNSLNH